jgi:hypothetical protein
MPLKSLFRIFARECVYDLFAQRVYYCKLRHIYKDILLLFICFKQDVVFDSPKQKNTGAPVDDFNIKTMNYSNNFETEYCDQIKNIT